MWREVRQTCVFFFFPEAFSRLPPKMTAEFESDNKGGWWLIELPLIHYHLSWSFGGCLRGLTSKFSESQHFLVKTLLESTWWSANFSIASEISRYFVAVHTWFLMGNTLFINFQWVKSFVIEFFWLHVNAHLHLCKGGWIQILWRVLSVIRKSSQGGGESSTNHDSFIDSYKIIHSTQPNSLNTLIHPFIELNQIHWTLHWTLHFHSWTILKWH